MFIQVIQGKVADADLLRRQNEIWLTEFKPRTVSYVGSTGGITPDGRSIMLACFDSEESAAANSDIPEQGAWWEATAPAFEGEATFTDCRLVDTLLGGAAATAGFVQIIQGRAKDQDQMRALAKDYEPDLRERRPEILGMVVGWHGDGGGFTQAVYFTSEDAARRREQESEQESGTARYQEMLDGEPTFWDLPEPVID